MIDGYLLCWYDDVSCIGKQWCRPGDVIGMPFCDTFQKSLMISLS